MSVTRIPAQRLALLCLLGFFLLLLSRCVPVMAPTPAAAFDIPYGVQDPFKSPGFPICEGNEFGDWQVLERTSSDGTRKVVYLVIMARDILDPAYVICYVAPRRKISAMPADKDS